MHFVYGECSGNANAAVRRYEERFPQRRVPDSNSNLRYKSGRLLVTVRVRQYGRGDVRSRV
jgi:hypothetical protein